MPDTTRVDRQLCGQVFLDRQGRIEGVCLDRVVPGTRYCTEHLIDHVARKDSRR